MHSEATAASDVESNQTDEGTTETADTQDEEDNEE